MPQNAIFNLHSDLRIAKMTSELPGIAYELPMELPNCRPNCWPSCCDERRCAALCACVHVLVRSAGSAESAGTGRPCRPGRQNRIGRVGRVGSAGRFGSAGSCRPGPTRPAPRRLAQHRLTPFLPCRQAPDMSNSNLRRNPSQSDSDWEELSPQIGNGAYWLARSASALLRVCWEI